jgi:sortase A
MVSQRRSLLRRAELVLFSVAGLSLSCWGAGIVGGEVIQFFAERSLDRAMTAASRDAAVSPSRPTDVRGAATGTACIGRIEIPRIRLSTVIVEGTGSLSLLSGAGHLVGSALPGEAGNVVLAAHRDTYFRSLGGVRADDLIRIVTPDRMHFYRVESTSIVEPANVGILAGQGDSRLTLVTCYPFHWLGPAPKRFIVVAREIDVHEAT